MCGYGNRPQFQTIYLQSRILEHAVEVYIALVVGAGIVRAVQLTQTEEFNGIHPYGAVLYEFFPVGPCQIEH